MLNESTLLFLSELRLNNNREWFNDNKSRYEDARDDVMALGELLRQKIHEFDPEISVDYPVKRSMFRIYRDTRFSRNKEPYKTNLGLVINDNGMLKNPLAGYYIHIEPGESAIMSGCYMPEAPVLKLLRDAFDLDWELFESEVMADRLFAEHIGDLCREDRVLKRVPNGYPKDSPAAEYLKLTSFYGGAHLSDQTLTSPSGIDGMVTVCRALKPLKEFLNRAIRYEE